LCAEGNLTKHDFSYYVKKDFLYIQTTTKTKGGSMFQWLKGIFSPVTKENSSHDGLNQVPFDRTDSIEGCVSAYVNAPKEGSSESRIMEKILKLARSFDDWRKIYDSVSPQSTLGKLSSQKMQETASSPSELKVIFRRKIVDVPAQTALGQRILAGISSFDDAKDFAILASGQSISGIDELIEARLEELSGSFDGWLQLVEGSPGKSSLEELATKKALEKSTDLDGMVKVYRATASDTEAEKLALDSIKEFHGSYSEWVSVLEDGVSDELDEVARRKIAATITDTDYLVDAENHLTDDEKPLVIEALKKLNLDKDEIRDLVDDNNIGGVIAEAIFEWLFETAETLTDFVWLHLNHVDDITSELEAKLVEAIQSKATKGELQLMKLIADEDSALWSVADEGLSKRD